ncbi:hypothetical protein Tco_0236715 [Tanacetum coccineum]
MSFDPKDNIRAPAAAPPAVVMPYFYFFMNHGEANKAPDEEAKTTTDSGEMTPASASHSSAEVLLVFLEGGSLFTSKQNNSNSCDKRSWDVSRLNYAPAMLVGLLGLGLVDVAYADALEAEAKSHLLPEAPTTHVDMEAIAKKERTRLEGLLKSKGMPYGSYPGFNIAVKGQKVTIKFQIPPTCEIALLISNIVTNLGVKVEERALIITPRFMKSYLPVPVNFIFIGFERSGNQAFKLNIDELERWFTKIDHIFEHTRIPQTEEVFAPFFKNRVDKSHHQHHLPLVGHLNYNFSVHAIQMSEKVNSIFEHAINVLSHKDDANNTSFFLQNSSNYEIVDAKLPEKNLKLGNNAPNMVAHGEQEISAVSVGINLTDEKSHDDILNDTLEECEQMTPPDADIYSKPKADKMLDVVVKPKPKLVFAPCSRMKMLHTPTSFTRRRFLPFLMSVAKDGLGTLKGNQSSKVIKGVEQIQQLPTLSLLHQNVGVDESKIISNPEQQDAANEKSDSPTSTLIPVDTSLDRLKISTLMSSNNLLDTHGPDMECSESATQLEVNSQSEAVEFYNSIRLELSSPKDNSYMLLEKIGTGTSCSMAQCKSDGAIKIYCRGYGLGLSYTRRQRLHIRLWI